MLVVMLLLISSFSLWGQEDDGIEDGVRKKALKVFIDCHRCDMDYIREQIPYVNYVRDVREAELYLLVTTQSTGSGGREYTLFFQGLKKYAGMNDTLIYASRPDDTRDHIREGRTNMIKMGLMRYVARTPLAGEVKITPSKNLAKQEVKDKWNYWVFELQTEPQFSTEQSIKEISWDNSASAYKVTPEWKLEFDFDQSFENRKYIYQDTTYLRHRSYWSSGALVVKSLTDHWSAGVIGNVNSSTYRNIELGMSLVPSLEYNIFPYSESNRKQLRILGGIGFNSWQYRDTTIYNKIDEFLVDQQLRIAFRVQQKWGYVNISMLASAYMNDYSKNRLTLNGYVRVRLFKGFSLRLSGSVSRIHDQLSLVKGEMDETEVLLRIREMATNYRAYGKIGIVYTFGSIYNNVVNPRFGS
jgi:hypothetical protein